MKIATDDPPDIDIEALEQSVHERVNEVRREAKLSTLIWNNKLAEVARAHSVDMGENHFFDHVNLRGESLKMRAGRGGFVCRHPGNDYTIFGLGENLYMTQLYESYQMHYSNGKAHLEFSWKSPERIAREAVEAWEESPGHRENLMRSSFVFQGIGIVLTEDHEIYVTQNLC